MANPSVYNYLGTHSRSLTNHRGLVFWKWEDDEQLDGIHLSFAYKSGGMAINIFVPTGELEDNPMDAFWRAFDKAAQLAGQRTRTVSQPPVVYPPMPEVQQLLPLGGTTEEVNDIVKSLL